MLRPFCFAPYREAPDPCGRPAAARLVLSGLSPRSPRRRVTLPGLAPRVLCELEGHETLAELELFCDTLIIDSDRELLTLLWRGEVPVASQAAHEVQRLIVALLPKDDPDAIDGALSSMDRTRENSGKPAVALGGGGTVRSTLNSMSTSSPSADGGLEESGLAPRSRSSR